MLLRLLYPAEQLVAIDQLNILGVYKLAGVLVEARGRYSKGPISAIEDPLSMGVADSGRRDRGSCW